ncbi:uncharacterized protein LOC122870187 isoform X2 [Siniperca chuatsi]|uniref:uncharacterized protein LOC122870187 isoform X2 n=1 Tax=Siniperca chuatsi TaxID=119488 RepID=UPI001CE16936|nr:uncharacterized protein LOC122870187 isoform X2 [Siniperca chuatsi]
MDLQFKPAAASTAETLTGRGGSELHYVLAVFQSDAATVSSKTSWTSQLSASDCVRLLVTLSFYPADKYLGTLFNKHLPSFVSPVMDVLLLLVAQVDFSYFAQKADAAFPRVSPDRLQFFEYETVSVSCEEFSGLTEWRVMRKLNKIIPTNSYNWNSSAPSCTIDPAFQRHSGEYWCEDAEGETSAAVNITVTAGSVILELPARPVLEGHDVVLHCRKEKTQSKHITDFYKDSFELGTSYVNNMTIHNVSKSDEGFYKCKLSGARESPESWLAVSKQSDNTTLQKYSVTSSRKDDETRPPHTRSPDLLTLTWTVVTTLVALLLLVMGLFLCWKHRVSAGDNAVVPDNVTYAVVNYQRKKKEPGVSRAATKPGSPERSVYSIIRPRD